MIPRQFLPLLHLLARNILPTTRCSCGTKLFNNYQQLRLSSSWSDDIDVKMNSLKVTSNRITKPFYHSVERHKKIGQELEAPIGDGLRKDWKSKRQYTKQNKFQLNKELYSRSLRKSGESANSEIIYGKFPVHISLQAKKRQFNAIYLKSSFFDEAKETTNEIIDGIIKMAKELKVPIKVKPRKFLDHLVEDPVQGLRQHQGVCADVSPLAYHYLDDDNIRQKTIDHSGAPLVWLIVQSVQDPNNFGAVLRSAYYLGVDRIITYNSSRLSPAVSKVSAGAVEILDVYETENLHNLLKVCVDCGWQVLGTTGLSLSYTNTISLQDISVESNTVVILGNEGIGISEDLASLCHAMITIPPHINHNVPDLHSSLDSLNVSVASGIIIHHLLNSRRF